MREFDFAPFYRSAIGFDHMLDVLQNALRADAGDSYPPYNIEVTGENAYRLTMAVAGFKSDEIAITAEQNQLLITGKKDEDGGGSYLHRGIATRAFERRFELADFVKVKSASLEHGLLSVDLEREVPDEMKPRKIPIGTSPRSIASKAA